MSRMLCPPMLGRCLAVTMLAMGTAEALRASNMRDVQRPNFSGAGGISGRQPPSSTIAGRHENVLIAQARSPVQRARAPSLSLPKLDETPPRKVALLVEPTPFTHVSGYSNRFKEMLRFLQQAGDDPIVITPDDSADRPADFLGMPITYVRGFRLIWYRQVQLTIDLGLRALRRLREFKPDVMHIAAPGFFVVPALIYARMLHVPSVVSYHTHLSVYADRYITWPGFKQLAVGLTNLILPLVLNRADLVLATSPQLKESLRAIGCKRVEVWRKGVDTDIFSPSFNDSNLEVRQQLTAGEPERPLLLYVGRLGMEKRIEMLRDVLHALPSARLAVVGGGPAEAQVRACFEKEDVVFTGVLSGEALSRAYAAADVFVMPSDSETLGFVVLEAMASGVPAVCANAGGLPSLVHDEVTGFLFRPGDADDLIAKVRTLLSDPQLCKQMGSAAREETLLWNWEAATSILRNEQYTMAQERFRQRHEAPGLLGRLKRVFRGARQPASATHDAAAASEEGRSSS